MQHYPVQYIFSTAKFQYVVLGYVIINDVLDSWILSLICLLPDLVFSIDTEYSVLG